MLRNDLAKEINPDKVAVYIRWSTEDQGEGTTLEVQMEACRNYIHSQGWTVNPSLIFIDEGWSGASLDRPAMTNLRKAVDEGQVDCVVVFKMDRLSRSVLDTVRLVLDEWEDTCFVKSAREPIDTTSQSGRMFFYMLTSYAEWERATIKDRTMSGRLKRAQEGRNPGFLPPYGYRIGDAPGAVVVVPEEAEIVRRIFEMYSRGIGVHRICLTLNREGITFTRAKRGIHWKQATIKYILKNRTYMGELVWGRRTKNPSRKRDPRAPQRIEREEPLVTVANALPAIVSPALFNLCQDVRSSKPRAGEGTMTGIWTTSDYLLTGVARCAGCGGMIRSKAAGGRTMYDYYLCTTRYEQGAEACEGGLIRQAELDGQIYTAVLRRCGSDQAREHLVTGRQEQLCASLASIDDQKRELDQQLGRLEAQKAKLRQQYRDEILTVTDFKEMRADIEQEQVTIQEQLQVLKSEQQRTMAALSSIPAWAEHLDRLQRWAELVPIERKHLLRRFVESVLVLKDAEGIVHCTINWTPGYAEEDTATLEFRSQANRPRRRSGADTAS